MHTAVHATHGAFDLGVAGMADQDDFRAPLMVAHDFHVHFGDERASGVEDAKTSALRFLLYPTRDAVRAEDDGRALRDLIQLVDEYRAFGAQIFHDKSIMHDLVAHIDRRPEKLERTLNDLDGAVDTRAKPSGIGKKNLHGVII